MVSDKQTCAAVARAVMNAKGLSQDDVRKLSGVSQATISRIMRGHVGNSFLNVVKVADALGVSVYDLLGRKAP